jgi:hypothetical protein
MTVGGRVGSNQPGSPITTISNILHGTYINTILECNSGSQAHGHIGALSPFRKKVYEDLPDKGEFCAFFIGADPFSNQPGQSAFQDTVTRISDRSLTEGVARGGDEEVIETRRDVQRNTLPQPRTSMLQERIKVDPPKRS